MDAKARVPIVDDDSINIDILRRILRKEYDLETAANGEQCLAKLLAFKPQLVLLDIMMPGINGYETCRRIKSGDLGEFVQVILVLSKGSTAERLQGRPRFYSLLRVALGIAKKISVAVHAKGGTSLSRAPTGTVRSMVGLVGEGRGGRAQSRPWPTMQAWCPQGRATQVCGCYSY